jgi:hypothetical protein
MHFALEPTQFSVGETARATASMSDLQSPIQPLDEGKLRASTSITAKPDPVTIS